MKIRNKKEYYDRVIFNILLILITMTFFEESDIAFISILAFVSMFLIPVLIVIRFIVIGNFIDNRAQWIIFAFVLFIILQIIGIDLDALYTSITPIFRSVTLLLSTLYIRQLDFSDIGLNGIRIASVFVLIIGYIINFLYPSELGYNPLIGNYNTVGALYFTLGIIELLLYIRCKRSVDLFIVLNCLIVIVLSDTRTAMFLFCIVALLYLLLKTISSKHFHPIGIMIFLIGCLLVFIVFYYNIKNSSLYDFLNGISQTLFDKNFDSGRPDLWHLAVASVGENKWLGMGTGIDLEYFYPWAKTTHSVYFDIYLQNGLLGIGCFILCIFTTLYGKGKYIYNRLSIMLLIIVFIMLSYNAVGIIFTKARSSIGVVQWMLMAMPWGNYHKTVFKETIVKKQIYLTQKENR